MGNLPPSYDNLNAEHDDESWDIGFEENAEWYTNLKTQQTTTSWDFGHPVLGVMNSPMHVPTLESDSCGVVVNENHGRFESAKDLLEGFQPTEMIGISHIFYGFSCQLVPAIVCFHAQTRPMRVVGAPTQRQCPHELLVQDWGDGRGSD